MAKGAIRWLRRFRCSVVMGASGDHSLSPVHAHLNLLGLVLMGVMGAFYALAGAAASSKLAWTNFILSNIGVVVMIPTLAWSLRSRTE